MNRIVSLLFLTLLTLRGWSQTADAFKGVWPVTDPAMMKSLNGTWQSVPAPFRPFVTQYDTYLLRYSDIK